MKYWAVDSKALNPNQTLIIETGRPLNISKNDNIIVFQRNGDYLVISYLIEDEITFNYRAKVLEVSLKQEEKNRYQLIANLSPMEAIDNPLTLRELAYSLQKVYRYDKPSVHFRRKYVSLSPDDFTTIVTGSIYWARTGFGLYVNTLRREQFAHFLDEVSVFGPGIFDSENLERAWQILREFVEEEYISAAELVHQIHAQADELHSGGLPELEFENIGISLDEPNEVFDSLYEQEIRLSRFMSIARSDKTDILEQLSDKMKKEAESETRFQKVFVGTPWPLLPTKIS